MPNVIIIGATSGIGRALAEAYARQGWRVGATGRRRDLLETLRLQYPDQVLTAVHDVTSPENIAVLEVLAVKLGGADLIIFNAGIGLYNKHIDWAPEEQTIAVNIRGFTEVATWAYRYFRERGGGHFAGLSSVGALSSNRTAPAYNASKAFVSNYMESLQQKARYDRLPIYVTDIRAGFVDTPMTKGNKRMFWIAPPEKAARQIIKAIQRRRQVAYITRRWALAGSALLLLRLLRNR